MSGTSDRARPNRGRDGRAQPRSTDEVNRSRPYDTTPSRHPATTGRSDGPGEEPALLEHALAYAARGWPVFPCRPRGKEPMVEGGFRSATTDPDMIRSWWARWPEANIGVPTGHISGIVVLDVDPRNGGDEALQALPPLPETVEVVTGGGGRHIYFRAPDREIRSRPNALGPGLDLKGDGGYVLVPPSLHPSGRAYEWEASSDPDEIPIAPLPDWVVEVVAEPAKAKTTAQPEGERIPEGRRNSTLASLAGTMRRLGMTREVIETGLLALNAAICGPPLPEDEVRKVAQSISRYEPEPGPEQAKARVEPPTVELLDEPPLTLSRPLQLVAGCAYAVTWGWTQTTVRESVDPKTGAIVRHDPPIRRTERTQLVVRDDGTVFGIEGGEPIEALGLDVAIPIAPRDGKLWSMRGLKAYRAGYRPSPLDVFYRLVAVVDRFMAFDRSLADQATMCELVACYALSTWFLDALDVIGFLWPNGPSGSGKTKLGVLVCEVAYLGEVLLAGSSYASLRDLADLGATLLFDDAEALADPKRTDPDKRALLLAGNRRGAVVAVKEPLPSGKGWRVRYVNAYCPRLFTAIRLPDPVLASRAIVIPLIRTADPVKANADPLDHTLWPCDYEQLRDDLWALALANLAEMPAHVAAVNADAPLAGRNLDPWKGVLAVAHWLEAHGVEELYARMCDLAQRYQTERVDLEAPDLTKLVVRALVDEVTSVTSMTSVTSARWDTPITIETSRIVDRVNALAIEEDLADEDGTPFASPKRIGKVLTALRIRQSRTAKKRQREITLAELANLAKSYGVTFDVPYPDPPSHTSHTSHSSHSSSVQRPGAQVVQEAFECSKGFPDGRETPSSLPLSKSVDRILAGIYEALSEHADVCADCRRGIEHACEAGRRIWAAFFAAWREKYGLPHPLDDGGVL